MAVVVKNKIPRTFNSALLKKGGSKIGAYLALISLIIVTVFPIFYMIVSSFKTQRELLLGGSILPKEWHFENYPAMLESIKFMEYFRNGLIISGATALICTTLAVFASYALVRFPFPGASYLDIAIIATQLIPGVMFLLPLYNVFLWINKTFGIQLVNTLHGMIGVYVAFFLPVSLFILRSFFATIPRELEEQAMIDGCSRLGAFIRVILPLCRPGLVATATTVFLYAWDELMFALILTSNTQSQPVSVGIRLFVGGQNLNQYHLVMAAATFVTIPVIIMFFFLQKQMISGLTKGAVKE